jgi:uncharacterized DUF497 family protein
LLAPEVALGRLDGNVAQEKLDLLEFATCKVADSSARATEIMRCDALDGPDLQHSSAEARFRRVGRSADGRVLMVAYTLRRNGDAETIRLISARWASRRERAAYAAKD